MVREAKEMIDSKVTINGTDISDAQIQLNLVKGQIKDTLHQIELLEQTIETNKEKLSAMQDAEKQEPKKYRQNEEDYLNKVKSRAKRICFRNWIGTITILETTK